MIEPKDNFLESVEAFLTHADWLTESDQPMVTALVLIAKELDKGGMSTRLVSDFGITYRHLASRRGDDSGPVSDAEAFLQGL